MADTEESSEESSSSSSSDSSPVASSSQPASRRKGRIWNSARLRGQPEHLSDAKARGTPAESSAKAGGPPKLPMPKLDLKALFDYHARMRQKRKRCRRPRTQGSETDAATKSHSHVEVPQPLAENPQPLAENPQPLAENPQPHAEIPQPHAEIPQPHAKRPRLKASQAKRKRMFRERCFQFPFVQKLYGQKHIPFRMEYLFEQEALQGFFKYIEMLKFEHQLKKSLAKLDATDDLEKESLESRRHKYLDDDGPLSPIAEPNEEDMNGDSATDDIGARVVENSCFILSEIPKQMKSKKKTKS